ncbi:MAG: baseplate wedge protein 53 [Bacteroidota bacterium]
MTIYLDSRYADGALFKGRDARNDTYVTTVFRTWPTNYKQVTVYEVKEVDRIEDIAVRYLGNPSLWWKIMDLNPEVLDPFDIVPGTSLRIPND